MKKTEIRVESVEAFFGQARKIAELADAGKRIPPSRVVAFEDARDLLSLLTAKRILLLKTLKEQPGSIAELARRLQRDRSAVTRDIQLLQRHGIVEVTEKLLPGHGRQKWVRPIARDIKVTAEL